MQEIKEDLKEILRSIHSIELDVAKNTKDLEHHIKRSDAADRRIEKLEYLLISLSVVGVLGGIAATLFK
jgi:hypothetical protein